MLLYTAEPKLIGKKGKGGKGFKSSPAKVVKVQVPELDPQVEEATSYVDVQEVEVSAPAATEEIISVVDEHTEQLVPGEDSKKSNLSMEALLLAANSELANFKHRGRTEVATVTTSGEGPSKSEGIVEKIITDNQEVIYVTIPSQNSVESVSSEQFTTDVVEAQKPVTTILRLDGNESGKVQLPITGQQTYRLVYAKNPGTSPELPAPVTMTHKPIILKSKQQDTIPTQGIVLPKPIVVAPPVGRKRKHPVKPGKHICSYCGRGCAKPSVLQKHIRAHTGERPYPCIPCGFSFKTKSNLYKHCKSRSHAIKAGLTKSLDEYKGEGPLPGQSSTDKEDEDLMDEDDEEEDIDSAEESALDDGESIKSDENRDGASTSVRVESEGTPKQRFKKKMKAEQKEKESVAKQNFVLVQQPSVERPSEDYTAAQNLLITESNQPKPGVQVVEGGGAGLWPITPGRTTPKTGTADKPMFLDVVFVSQDGTLIPAIRSTGKAATIAPTMQGRVVNQQLMPSPRLREVSQEDANTAVKVATISSMVKEALPKLSSPLMQLVPADTVVSGAIPETPSFSVSVPTTSSPPQAPTTSRYRCHQYREEAIGKTNEGDNSATQAWYTRW